MHSILLEHKQGSRAITFPAVSVCIVELLCHLWSVLPVLGDCSAGLSSFIKDRSSIHRSILGCWYFLATTELSKLWLKKGGQSFSCRWLKKTPNLCYFKFSFVPELGAWCIYSTKHETCCSSREFKKIELIPYPREIPWKSSSPQTRQQRGWKGNYSEWVAIPSDILIKTTFWYSDNLSGKRPSFSACDFLHMHCNRSCSSLSTQGQVAFLPPWKADLMKETNL